jgi:hypothetical protein
VHALALALVLQSTAGVAYSAQRFSPVPEPAGIRDPCRDEGPAGRWVKLSAAGAPASVHNEGWLDSASVWTGAQLVVVLRRDGKWNGTGFDPCHNAWSPVPEAREPPRSEPWLSGDHDRPFVPSHAKSSYDGFERISVWDPGRKVWVAVTAPAPLAPREHYAVALVGRRLIVWGGWTREMQALGDGAVLDLARKSWKKMSAAGAPSPRLEPTAVAWTGSRLLVWGGRVATPTTLASPRLLGDGARYDPAADRWTPMSSVDAPSPRVDATVAWTGRRLVVLGGAAEVGGQPLRDGGAYDPATDRWTRLPAPPGDLALPKSNVGPLTRILVAPDGRVVFLPENLGAVAVLDADRASWSLVATQEPGKRASFRAFLLGRRLIVWGGMTVLAEHLCPPPVPGQPICDSFAETAPRNDGWMMLLPP